MVISYFGVGMVKVSQGDMTLVFSPIGELAKGDEAQGPKIVKFGADLALVSISDRRWNGVANVTRSDRSPFIISGPGEYEVGGIFVKGFGTAGPNGLINTIYLLVLDDLRLVHLGALTTADLDDQVKENLGAIDILFVPVGGNGLGDSKAASRLIADLEPRVVVPVNWTEGKALRQFLKEEGAEAVRPVETWTVRRKDLVERTGELILVKTF